MRQMFAGATLALASMLACGGTADSPAGPVGATATVGGMGGSPTTSLGGMGGQGATGGDGGTSATGGMGGSGGAGGVPCSERPLLGVGALDDWIRKTTGANSCSWSLPTQGVGLNTDADCRFFDEVWPLPWPGSQNTRNLTVFSASGREFIAMEFDSGNIAPHHEGRMTQEVPQFAGANSGWKLWSISPCPGDFNAEVIEAEMGPGCVKRDQFSFIDAFNWGGTDATADPLRCAMKPHTRYYLNIVWTDAQAGTPPAQIEPNPTCVGQRCGGNFTPAGIYVP